ncbi:hypothetical protein BH23ACI1_BH23ACI1_00110 [soil metagenome]
MWTRCTALVLALVVGALAAPVVGQGLTGTIEGTVRDQTGAVLPGVTVTLSSPGLLGGPQVRVTEMNGAYRFANLSPGTYTLLFELAGFQRLERAGLIISPNRTLTLDQTLGPTGVVEEVTVTGDVPTVDVRSTAVTSTIGSAEIEQLPVARRFTDLLNTMPGVQNGLYTFSPINAVYGSKVTDNVYQVDGVNFVDPNVSAPITDVAFDDIAEVEVSTSGQTAEFGSASGGVFNFITKSGSNQFRGLGAGYLQNKSLTGSNISSELEAQGIRPTVFDHQYDFGANLGGPIIRNRLFFFGSYFQFDQKQSISDFPVPIPTTQWQTTGKVDAQLNNSNRLSVMFNYRDRTWEPFNFGFTTAGDPRTWIGIQWKNPLSTMSWTSTPTSRTVLRARFGLALFDLVNYEPFVEPGTPVFQEINTGVLTGGPSGSFGVQQRDRYAFNADVSHFLPNVGLGNHELKFGMEYEWLRMNNSRRDQAAADGIFHQTLGGLPFRVQLRNWEAQRKNSIDHFSVFAQDQWAIGDKTTVNAGLRLDRWSGRLGPDELLGSRFFAPESIGTNEVISGLTHVSPRLGVAYDLFGDRRIALKANWGRFYQRLDGTVTGIGETGGFGVLTYDWLDCRTPAGVPTTCQTAGALPGDGRFTGDSSELGTLRGDSRPLGSGAVDPDLKMPYSDSFNAGIEWDLGNNLGLQVNYIHKRERDIWNRVNLSTFDLGAADPYAMAYNRYSVVNPASGQPLDIFSLKPEFQGRPPLLLLTNPDNPVRLFRDYNGLELVLRRRLADRWSMQASYNLGRSEGSVGTLFFDHQGNPYLNPNSLINIRGDQQLDRRHMFKLNGIVQGPYGINLSSRFQVLSGVPWYTSGSGGQGVTGVTYVRFDRGVHYPASSVDPFIRVPGEPQGSQRFDAEVGWDFRAEKRQGLPGNRSLDLMLDVFNLLNANTIVRVQTLNSDLANYLRPAEIQQPRAARIGIRFNF